VPNVNGKLAMKEKMINSFLILLTKATLVNQLKPPPSKIVCYEDSTQSCSPYEESNVQKGLHLPNAFSWE
jgi:hypothetical protein